MERREKAMEATPRHDRQVLLVTRWLLGLWFAFSYVVERKGWGCATVVAMSFLAEAVFRYRQTKRREDLLGVVGLALMSVAGIVLTVAELLGR